MHVLLHFALFPLVFHLEKGSVKDKGEAAKYVCQPTTTTADHLVAQRGRGSLKCSGSCENAASVKQHASEISACFFHDALKLPALKFMPFSGSDLTVRNAELFGSFPK